MVFDTVKTILAEQLDANEDDITLETSVIDDLGADSLDVVDIIMSLEEEFDLEVPDEDIETIKTVGDLVKYIEDHTDSE
ncbi:MAG: acyl carrier protein [Oscillospiraceae bacterium]|nr:acyl carrier protein [Oscillospiraceae bacterium]MBR2806533.1 acyl carrier protein [Oscillospiraceae bacterium]